MQGVSRTAVVRVPCAAGLEMQPQTTLFPTQAELLPHHMPLTSSFYILSSWLPPAIFYSPSASWAVCE